MKALGYLYRSVVGSCVALAVLGFISTNSVLAQEKGAQKLMKLEKVEDLQKIEAGDTIVMTCHKCKDTYTQVVEKTYKASKPEELKTLKIHLCDSCETKVVSKGTGKQAKDELVHTCKTCGSEDVSCCVMKKSGGTTKGMEKKM